jgi:hypothetical protein
MGMIYASAIFNVLYICVGQSGWPVANIAYSDPWEDKGITFAKVSTSGKQPCLLFRSVDHIQTPFCLNLLFALSFIQSRITSLTLRSFLRSRRLHIPQKTRQNSTIPITHQRTLSSQSSQHLRSTPKQYLLNLYLA